MKSAFLLVLLGILLTVSACRQIRSDDELIEKGTSVSKELVNALMTELQAEISENGLPDAINYCSLHALPIADSISRLEQLKVSRVSHRFRNPMNASDDKETAMIEKYTWQQKAGEELHPQVVKRNGQKIYYAPILLASPLCLSCHGPYENIDPDVRNVLNERYPDDRAVDFRLNEVRGMFKIVFD